MCIWPFGVKIEDSFRRELEIPGPIKLEVSTVSGDVTIGRGEEGRVYISGRFTVRARSTAKARRLAMRIKEDPPIKLVGNILKVGDFKEYRGRPFEPSIVIDFEIKAPQATEVELDSGSGDLWVEGLRGPIRAESYSGDIQLSDIESEVRAETRSGDIRACNIGGIEVDTGSGDVEIEVVRGNAKVKLGSGDISIKEAQGDVKLTTGSGDISINSGIGEGASWELKADSGDVELALPEGSRFSLRAGTGSGEIELGFPLKITKKTEQTLAGEAGEGPRASIRIETYSGDISIRAC